MTFRIAFQMDALSRLKKPIDTTLYIARAAAMRGYELFHYEPQHLRLDVRGTSCRVTAQGHALQFDADASDPWSLGEEQTVDLSGYDVILMRQDPPFDMAYITATHILEHLVGKVRVVNDPAGVRNAPEKLLVTHFPQLTPPTLITRDSDAIHDFRAQHGDVIVKPLHGYASYGVFHLKPEDDNLSSLIEMMASLGNEPWIVQKFLPVATLGDKRIVLLDGEPVGVYRRMPAVGDVRGSTRVGGRAEAAPLTARDQEICAVLRSTLRERGLFLVGLDVIGDSLTEINVTSPSGLVFADKIAGRSGKDSIAEQFWTKIAG